jgi:hypothetical protein
MSMDSFFDTAHREKNSKKKSRKTPTKHISVSMSQARLFILSAVLIATVSAVRVVHMIRHGEKPTDPNDPNLSPQGFERAACST